MIFLIFKQFKTVIGTSSCQISPVTNIICHARTHARTHTHTHTHTQPFYSSLDFVRDDQGELVPEGTFCHLLDFLVQNEDNTGTHVHIYQIT